jgi:hypothetical protein
MRQRTDTVNDMIDTQAVEKSEQHRFKGRNVTTPLSSHTASWDFEHRAPLMPGFSTEQYRRTACFGSHFKIDMLELAHRLQKKQYEAVTKKINLFSG